MRLRLTAFTDFGLRVPMHMAGEPCRPFTAAGLAGAFGVSRRHRAKMTSALADGGGAMPARLPEAAFPADLNCGSLADCLWRPPAVRGLIPRPG